MKKYLLLFFAMLILLSGCTKGKEYAEDIPKIETAEFEEQEESVQSDEESTKETPKTEVSETVISNDTQCDKVDTSDNKSKQTQKVENKAECPTGTNSNIEEESVIDKPTSVEKVPEVKEETQIKDEEVVITPPNATADESREVADKVISYINQYRSVPAMKLNGLTEYAEYRSRQLVSNFAHDMFDEREAATTLKYGTYIDPTLYGIEGTPYYTSGAREAIAKAGYVGTVDYVAEQLASLVKNSANHWAYVGSTEYKYIAVGITYESGMWYCDIAVSTENTDNK